MITGSPDGGPGAAEPDARREIPLSRDRRVQGLVGIGIVVGFLIGLLVFGKPWGLPPAWGDIPTWISAIATIGLLIGAIITAVYAIKAFGAQSVQLKEQREINAKQTEVFQLQVDELRKSLTEREREAGLRHRAQAARVFITQDRRRTAQRGHPEPEGAEKDVIATVVNSSDQPIYDAELRWHLGPGAHGKTERLGAILPEKRAIRERLFPADADLSNSGADVMFTDANSIRWLRRPDGYLSEFRQT